MRTAILLTFTLYLLLWDFRSSLCVDGGCTAPAGECKEYCHNDEFRAVCTGHSVILLTSALYGRMTIGPCVKTDFGFVGCSRDVIVHLHERCSGRQACSVRVPDASLDMTDPCNQDLKSYLDVSFTCVTGTLIIPTGVLIIALYRVLSLLFVCLFFAFFDRSRFAPPRLYRSA